MRFGVDGDETPVRAALFSQLVEMRTQCAAGCTPGRPEVDQNRPALGQQEFVHRTIVELLDRGYAAVAMDLAGKKPDGGLATLQRIIGPIGPAHTWKKLRGLAKGLKIEGEGHVLWKCMAKNGLKKNREN